MWGVHPRGGVGAAALATAAGGEENRKFGEHFFLREGNGAAEVHVPAVVTMSTGSGGSPGGDRQTQDRRFRETSGNEAMLG
jgi:hypothetical protein